MHGNLGEISLSDIGFNVGKPSGFGGYFTPFCLLNGSTVLLRMFL
jgi:hypothetical protein